MKTCLNCKEQYQDTAARCPKCGETCARMQDGALAAGTVLAGRYVITGTMKLGGAVTGYEANDRLIGGRRVIKEYSPSLCDGRENAVTDKNLFAAGCEIFSARMRNAAHISDESCNDLFKANGTIYVVRPYINGTPLSRLVAEGVGEQASKYMILKKLTEQLLIMKNKGGAHGAVSPDNIIIKDDGGVILTDPAVPMIRDGKLCYAAVGPYSAPELNNGSGITFEADIYSLCAVCYYVLTGKAPSASSDPQKDIPASTGLGGIIANGLSDSPAARSKVTAALSGCLSSLTGSGMGKSVFTEEGDLATVEITSTELSTDTVVKATEDITENRRTSGKDTAAGPPKKKRTGKKLTPWGGTVIAAVLLVVLGIGAFSAVKFADKMLDKKDSSSFVSNELRVPDLSGKSLEAAQKEAESLGLRISAKDKANSDEVEENMIMLQDPKNGAVCRKGDVIYVTISAGRSIRMLVAENYVGSKFDEVKKLLEGYGVIVEKEENSESVYKNGVIDMQDIKEGTALKSGDKVKFRVSAKEDSEAEGSYPVPYFVDVAVDKIDQVSNAEYFDYNIVYEYSSEYETGRIFRQSVDAYGYQQAGTEITLYVSKGLEYVIVPDTQYKTLEQAQQLLRDNKLEATVSYAESSSVEKGHVISQGIQKDSKVEAGTAVSLVISQGYTPAPEVASPDPPVREETPEVTQQQQTTVQEIETVPEVETTAVNNEPEGEDNTTPSAEPPSGSDNGNDKDLMSIVQAEFTDAGQ